jgi:hypothetical protein
MAGAAAHQGTEKDAGAKKIAVLLAKRAGAAAALCAVVLQPASARKNLPISNSSITGASAEAKLTVFGVAAQPRVVAAPAVERPSPAEDLEHLQERFDKETDGVRKAKLLEKLGDAQFEKEREAAKAGDYTTVGLVMEKYRDNAQAALEALKRSHPQAEKHPGGYKQLEFHMGRGLREVRDVILAMPEQFRPPMQIVEKDLLDIDTELLKLLFPRRPGEQQPVAPPQAPASNLDKKDQPEKQP